MLVQKLRNTESFSASSIGSVEVTVFDPDFNIYVSTNAEDRLVHLSRYNVLFARPNDEVTSQGPADTSEDFPDEYQIWADGNSTSTRCSHWTEFFRACGMGRLISETIAETFVRERIWYTHLAEFTEARWEALGVRRDKNKQRILAYLASTNGNPPEFRRCRPVRARSSDSSSSSIIWEEEQQVGNVYILSTDLLIDAFQFLDYAALVSLSFTSSLFRRVISAKSALLACRHSFKISILDDRVDLVDLTTVGIHPISFLYDPDDPQALLDTLCEIKRALGCHHLEHLTVAGSWTSRPLLNAVDILPAMREVGCLEVHSPTLGAEVATVDDFLDLLGNFASLRQLVLRATRPTYFKLRVFCEAALANNVPELIAHAPRPDERDVASLAVMADHCTDFSLIPAGATKFVQFDEMPRAFVDLIVERIVRLPLAVGTTAQCALAVMFRLSDVHELQLPDEEFERKLMDEVDGAVMQFVHRSARAVVVFFDDVFCTVTNMHRYDPFRCYSSQESTVYVPFSSVAY